MKVAIYARYSTDKQDESSITGQIKNCEALAESQGWQIVERYSDEAISGLLIRTLKQDFLLARPRR